MSMSRVTPPDISLWLCDRIRAEHPHVECDIRIPDGYTGDHPLVVVRDDGGPQSDWIVFDRSLGITVYGWDETNPKPLRDLAADLYAQLTDDELAYMDGSPITAVTQSGCNGPYPVSTSMACAGYYLTVEYSTVGTH